jgi:HNH endonuclease/HIT domain
VDHIIPRKHGGEDDLTNLQALCFKCNANKGARDDADFRMVREEINARQSGCFFCELPVERIIASSALAFAALDSYPVTELHTLVIPRRHAATFFDLFPPAMLEKTPVRDVEMSEDKQLSPYILSIKCLARRKDRIDSTHGRCSRDHDGYNDKKEI